MTNNLRLTVYPENMKPGDVYVGQGPAGFIFVDRPVPELENIINPLLLSDFAEKHGIRKDWHEPDNNGIGARIVGTHLDNAFGPRVEQSAIENGYQEYVVILTKDGEDEAAVNLADLLAWACV